MDLAELLVLRERLPDLVSELHVTVVNRVEDYEPHLLDIWQSVLGEVLLIHADCENVPHEEEPCAARVDFPGHPAFEGHREIGEHRGVHFLSLDGCPSGPADLVGHFPSADVAHIVGCRHGLGGRESHRELVVPLKVVCRGMHAHRYEYLPSVPLAAPGCVHRIRCPVLVVGADDEHRLREHPWFRIKSFHILLVLKAWQIYNKLDIRNIVVSLIFVIFAVIITAMATKIKKILSLVPQDSLLFSSWLAEQGIDRKEQTLYVRSGWLERVANGVYKFEGSASSLYVAVASYNAQLGKRCHVGASSALDLRGYSHFVAMGKPLAYLFTTSEQRLPAWILKVEWDRVIRYFTTSVFSDGTGLEEYDYRSHKLLISSPERAFMECLHLAPSSYSLMDAYYIMEMLTTLRPKLVQQLLEECSSVKIKRLFLYMAEKSGHQWFNALNVSKIDLGKGDRLIAPGGKYIGKYGIIIPSELAEYE